MSPEEKNAPIINELGKKGEELRIIRDFFKSKYNNRENSFVIAKLQEAEFWLDEQIKKLK